MTVNPWPEPVLSAQTESRRFNRLNCPTRPKRDARPFVPAQRAGGQVPGGVHRDVFCSPRDSDQVSRRDRNGRSRNGGRPCSGQGRPESARRRRAGRRYGEKRTTLAGYIESLTIDPLVPIVPRQVVTAPAFIAAFPIRARHEISTADVHPNGKTAYASSGRPSPRRTRPHAFRPVPLRLPGRSDALDAPAPAWPGLAPPQPARGLPWTLSRPGRSKRRSTT